jgi:KDO2-lipid IV(A) lauroyltransferase
MSERVRDFKLRRWPPLQFVLYLLLRTVLMVVNMFPYRMAPTLGSILGGVIRIIDRKHVRIARKNLERTPSVVRPRKIPAFIRRVYKHMGLGIVEMLMTPRLMMRREISQRVRLVNFEILPAQFAKGRGAIMAIGHLGNWELGGLAVAEAGYPIHSLARPIENPWIDRYLNRFRRSTGQEIISKYGAMGSMVKTLKSNGMLVIQVDQDARSSGVLVDFFGRPASTQRSAALLALKYGSPVIPVDVHREGGRIHAILGDPIDPDSVRNDPDPVRKLTQLYTTALEGYVRKHPEQWFWVHDRWKSAERLARTPEGRAMGLTAAPE